MFWVSKNQTSMEKMGQNFNICLQSGPRWLTPSSPPYSQPDRKISVFLTTSPKKNTTWKWIRIISSISSPGRICSQRSTWRRSSRESIWNLWMSTRLQALRQDLCLKSGATTPSKSPLHNVYIVQYDALVSFMALCSHYNEKKEWIQGHI